jgi:protein-tyrosine phosphatase
MARCLFPLGAWINRDLADTSDPARLRAYAWRVRRLDWEGCGNVRDLGGLPTDRGETRWGAAVRADALDRLTAAGWDALVAHGVRTVIDLRNDVERGADATPRPDSVTTLHLPLDGAEDRDFWDVWDSGPQFGTPLYYRPHLERFPERSAAVLEAIARAEPGGVAFHCQSGRDRAGQIAMLLLAIAGVPPEHIAADYALSREHPECTAYLEARGTTAAEVIVATLAELEVESRLGLAGADIAALRARLVEGASP